MGIHGTVVAVATARRAGDPGQSARGRDLRGIQGLHGLPLERVAGLEEDEALYRGLCQAAGEVQDRCLVPGLPFDGLRHCERVRQGADNIKANLEGTTCEACHGPSSTTSPPPSRLSPRSPTRSRPRPSRPRSTKCSPATSASAAIRTRATRRIPLTTSNRRAHGTPMRSYMPCAGSTAYTRTFTWRGVSMRRLLAAMRHSTRPAIVSTRSAGKGGNSALRRRLGLVLYVFAAAALSCGSGQRPCKHGARGRGR